MSRLGKLFYSHRIGSQNEHWRFLCLIVDEVVWIFWTHTESTPCT